MRPRRRDPLLAVASHCTVRNTLRQEPGVALSQISGSLCRSVPAGGLLQVRTDQNAMATGCPRPGTAPGDAAGLAAG